jgi:uncharacterized protein with von Willebrand factor type A (vWA) domain
MRFRNKTKKIYKVQLQNPSLKSLKALMRFLKKTCHPGTDFRKMLEIENS